MRLIAFLLPACLAAQVWSSGSNGSDGDLNFTGVPSGTTIVFDPKDKVRFPPNGLDVDNDLVFHFKSITIPAGVTVRLTAAKLPGPVYWLSQGGVNIQGSLNLNGESAPAAAGVFAQPGPGGYMGGGRNPVTAGFGPGGGARNGTPPVCGSDPNRAAGGRATVTEYMVPLVGGSGGGGAPGGGGGAGGGAILLASDTTITLASALVISADGGWGYGEAGSGGAGGSIRLAARTIATPAGGAYLSVRGGQPSYCVGEAGLARIEALAIGGVTVYGRSTIGSPIDPYLPASSQASSLRVVSVGGVPVNPSPTGSFDIPDATINTADPVPVVVETSNVPVGTVIKLYLYSENGTAMELNFPPLAGTGATLAATTSTKFPYGFSRSTLRASFTR